ncbi:DUF1287 domain-containing protein [Pelagibius litoralis]|uniref:DUF1287 domain-containing protein n=2 Tax=Pelagibius litoralis TaxID=374515 RepID=A0A967EY85_9PROT|nr:DUF1287 domain-containing protein [Pelagibius litoralis]
MLLPAGGALAQPAGPAAEIEASASDSFSKRLNAAALARTKVRVTYDPAYLRIAYPGGDVAADRGVCSDVVIRAYRTLGIDLQQLVHEDMRKAFDAYPAHWGLTRPDSNIDHRRVPNLETFLRRQGAALPKSENADDYKPGDLVAWNLRGPGGFLPHIGIVTDRIAPSGRPKIVHNIGAGPQLEDVLFSWPMTGHYRYQPTEFMTGGS